MDNRFFEDPILNSPYERPTRHWELDKEGIPTQKIIDNRRESRLITPIPKPKKRDEKNIQRNLDFDETKNISNDDQQYEVYELINRVRFKVEEWRQLPESLWGVTPETSLLLKHWRNYEFEGIKPFFLPNRGG